MAELFAKNHYSTVIVGAGLQGLAYARTCIRLDPDTDLLVLEASQTIGGVWAKERLYPHEHTNNLVSTYEFSDYPMLDADLGHLGVAAGRHIPGPAVQAYLSQFADKENITQNIRFGCKLVTAQETETDSTDAQRLGWALTVNAGGQQVHLTCNILVLATGICTKPRKTTIPGQSSFGKPLFPLLDLGTHGTKVADDPDAQHVTVLGTGKSSYDSVYMFANAGKRVTWIIRTSGSGARYMARPYVWLGPFKKWLEGLLMTRPLTLLSPCIFGAEDGYGWIRNLIHRTRIGQFVVRNFFAQITRDKLSQAGYYDDAKFKPLIPRQSFLWHATQSGIFNFPTEFFDLVRSDAIQIVERDISELQPEGTIVFTDGTRMQTDALITATGWEVSAGTALLPESKHAEWGIPSQSHTDAQKREWQRLHAKAEMDVRLRLPMLANQPEGSVSSVISTGQTSGSDMLDLKPKSAGPDNVKTSPWRLYRSIAPPSHAASASVDRNIIFLSAFSCFQGPLRAELAALWAWAFLNRQLTREPADLGANAVWHDTALFGQWAALRYPLGFGPKLPEVMLDGLPYFDMLMNDLGLPPRRGLWGDLFGGRYRYDEWAGMIEEWQELQRTRSRANWTTGADARALDTYENGVSKSDARDSMKNNAVRVTVEAL